MLGRSHSPLPKLTVAAYQLMWSWNDCQLVIGVSSCPCWCTLPDCHHRIENSSGLTDVLFVAA